MKKCKSCKADIPNDAKKCSHCGTDQRNWAKKHPILTGLGVIIVIFIILGVAGSGSSKNGSSSSGSNTASSNQPAKAAKIGDTVTDNNQMSFTVNNVTTAQTLGNSYTAKTAQGIYEVINVTIKNGGKTTATINSSDFKLTDSQGRTFDTSTDGETAKSMAEGKSDFFLQQVQPGLNTTGDLVFDIPANDAGLKLLVQGSLFSDGQTIDLGK